MALGSLSAVGLIQDLMLKWRPLRESSLPNIQSGQEFFGVQHPELGSPILEVQAQPLAGAPRLHKLHRHKRKKKMKESIKQRKDRQNTKSTPHISR